MVRIVNKTSEAYREMLVQQVQALARDVENLASGLVGNEDLISNFEIYLKFPPNELPTITLIREHIGQEATKITFNRGVDTEHE